MPPIVGSDWAAAIIGGHSGSGYLSIAVHHQGGLRRAGGGRSGWGWGVRNSRFWNVEDPGNIPSIYGVVSAWRVVGQGQGGVWSVRPWTWLAKADNFSKHWSDSQTYGSDISALAICTSSSCRRLKP